MSAYFPSSWHEPRRGVPRFNNAKNMIGFVDGHIGYIKFIGTAIGPNDFALQYDPPNGDKYQWSGDK